MKLQPCEMCGSTDHCNCIRPYAGLVSSFARVIHEPLKQNHRFIWFISTAEYIEALSVGDRVLDSFGEMSEILQIIHRPFKQDGIRFVTFYTSFSQSNSNAISPNSISPNSILPGVLVEDRLVITSPLQAEFDQEALVEIEYEFLRNIAINKG